MVGLEIGDTVARLVEIFEFAARWSQEIPVGERLKIHCKLSGLKDRRLYLSPHWLRTRASTNCSSPEWEWERCLSVPEITAEPRDYAIKAAIALFELFGWDPSVQTIRDMQPAGS
jgi:hypothetical protein